MIDLLFAIAAAADLGRVPPGTPVINAVDERLILTSASGVATQTLERGSGPRPTRKSAVRVELEVRLADGTLVEAPAQPVGLAVSDVIPGLADALLWMRQGGLYRVWVPAKLAYGKTGNADGSVPPNSDLVFTIRLLAVGRAKRTR
jgi:FKBP-type peptidyl-prolyl cis-trans isomerase